MSTGPTLLGGIIEITKSCTYAYVYPLRPRNTHNTVSDKISPDSSTLRSYCRCVPALKLSAQ